jgi:hypothetical protein
LTDVQKEMAKEEMKAARAQVMSLDCGDPMDESYRRIVYIRYADDFLIGVNGSKEDCQRIKNELSAFIRDTKNIIQSFGIICTSPRQNYALLVRQ